MLIHSFFFFLNIPRVFGQYFIIVYYDAYLNNCPAMSIIHLLKVPIRVLEIRIVMPFASVGDDVPPTWHWHVELGSL